jgi:hypothetical protein
LEGTTVLKKTLSILGVASIVTGTSLWSGEPKALGAGGVSPARSAAKAYEPPSPDRRERTYGPFKTRCEAEEKCRELKPHWHCRIVYGDDEDRWYVFAWKNRR